MHSFSVEGRDPRFQHDKTLGAVRKHGPFCFPRVARHDLRFAGCMGPSVPEKPKDDQSPPLVRCSMGVMPNCFLKRLEKY